MGEKQPKRMDMESRMPTIFDELGAFLAPRRAESCCSHLPSISEDEDHLFIDAPLPGVDSGKIEVTLDPKKRLLTISGKQEAAREEVHYHLKGKSAFSYEIPLSHEIDMEKGAAASSKNGLLSISLEKNKRNKPLKIDVRVA